MKIKTRNSSLFSIFLSKKLYKPYKIVYYLIKVVIESMNDNKKVLTYCPNFYKIIEFKPIEGDEVTKASLKCIKNIFLKLI